MSYVADDDRFAVIQRVIRGRMPELDGLRGLAVIAVVIHNTVWSEAHAVAGMLPKLLNVVVNAGWLGVQLFFVLSGFLITGILLDEKGAPQQLRNFYVRRVLRIFPLYYLTLFAILVLLPQFNIWLGGEESLRAAQPIWYWLFLSNWSIPVIGGPGVLSHYWSLAVEEQFYLLWPFAILALSRRAFAALCIFLIVVSPLARALMIFHDLEFARWRAYEFTFARWDALAMGALLALTMRYREWWRQAVRVMRPVLIGSAVYMLGTIVVLHGYAPVDAGIVFANQSVAALLFAAALYFAIFPAQQKTPWQRFLSNEKLRTVGKYSYAIYVFHYPVIAALHPLWAKYCGGIEQVSSTLDTYARVLAVSVVSFLLAYCSWRLIEQPCLSLRRFFISRKAAVAV
jgi:peptidoglycan/LPS O-acetylase OafA/YrhL